MSSGPPRLRLLAWVPADTVHRADSIPLVVAIWNEGPPVDVMWPALAHGIEVLDSRGRRITSNDAPDWHHEWGYGPGWIRPMPTGAFFGNVINLACVVYRPDPPRRRLGGPCDLTSPIHEPGEYRVIAHYFTAPEPDLPNPRVGIDYLELHSDTARFTFAPSR